MITKNLLLLFYIYLFFFYSYAESIENKSIYYEEYNKIKEIKQDYSFYDYLKDKRKEIDKRVSYKNLKIKECTLPIRDNLSLLLKDDIKYSYFEKDGLPFINYTISIFSKNYEKKFLEFLKQDKKLHIKKTFYKEFTIIETTYKDLEYFKDYYIYGLGISIHINYGNKLETKYIIDYCLKTKSNSKKEVKW